MRKNDVYPDKKRLNVLTAKQKKQKVLKYLHEAAKHKHKEESYSGTTEFAVNSKTFFHIREKNERLQADKETFEKDSTAIFQLKNGEVYLYDSLTSLLNQKSKGSIYTDCKICKKIIFCNNPDVSIQHFEDGVTESFKVELFPLWLILQTCVEKLVITID